MSKKFPKLKSYSAVKNQHKKCINQFDFSKAGSTYVVLDADFSDGLQFIEMAQSWLSQTHSGQRLYYYALQVHPFLSQDALHGTLGIELNEKWPPLLPGLHLIDLAEQRIELCLWLGDLAEGMRHLLSHHNALVHQLTRPFAIDQYFLDQSLPSDALEVLRVLQGQGVLKDRLKNSPWPLGENSPQSKESKLIIVGGGLAGCYMAYSMAKMGWRVALFESNARCGEQGSGNAYSVLYPKLSVHQAPFTELLHQAYPYAFQVWREILIKEPRLGRCLPLWQGTDEFLDELAGFLESEPEWFERVTIPEPGLLMKKSLIVDMPQLCAFLVQHPLIECHFDHSVNRLEFIDDEWQIGAERAPFCIVANGFQATQWPETQFLGVKGMRGQMTHVSGFSEQEVVYCKTGHFLPEWRGIHALGASYQAQYLDLTPSAQDDEYNLAPWRDFFNKPLEAQSQWVGVRGVSLDHIPIVGFMPQAEEFKTKFKRWQHHANWIMNEKMPNYPGLFAFCGFGSRGLLTIPLMARVIRNFILNEPVFLPNHLLQAISPGRFLKKELSRQSVMS